MVPVLDRNNVPLMPCAEKRARKLMEKGEAKPYWQKGIFCIKLLKEPSARNYQPIAFGIDPGSKREGYTVATAKAVVLNITSDTPDWVKAHLETRRNLRRARRYRKTPYRSERGNRATLRKEDRVPPSTKARWDAKLRVLKLLQRILPLTIVNVEDIKAVSKANQRKWNGSFSPLEVGKRYFYQQIKDLKLNLILTEGYDTKTWRDNRGFTKLKTKLVYSWEAHNVDSHCLAEMALQQTIKPSYGLWQLNFLEFHRRQLHDQQPKKGGQRRPYGSTVSLGFKRGNVLKYRNKLAYLGGTSKGKVAVHSIKDKERINQYVKLSEIKVLYTSSWRVQFLPRLKPWVSLHNFS